jgi:hypothetical protein
MYKPKSSVSFALRAIAEPARSKQNDKSHPVSQLSSFTPRLRYTRRIKSSSHSPHSSRRSIDRSIDTHEESESEKNARPDPLSDQIRTRPLIDPSSRSPTPPLLSTRRRVVKRISHHSHIIRNKKNTRLTSNPHSNLNQIKSKSLIQSIEACRNAARTFILCIRGRRPSIQRAIIERFREGQSMRRRRRRHARRRRRRGDRHARRRRQSSSYSRHLVWKGAASRSVPFRSIRCASRWRPNRPFVNRRSVKMGVRTCFDWCMCIVDVF